MDHMAQKSEVIIMTLAARAAGIVTRAELLRSGLPTATINDRVRRGQLLRVWTGLYEVVEMTNEFTPYFRAIKSVVGSAISHYTAARIQHVGVGSLERPDVVHIMTRWGGPRTTMPGVVCHRTRADYSADVENPVPGLPVLSLARTVLDLAGEGRVSDARLRDIVESAVTHGRLHVSDLQRLLNRDELRGVAGVTRLRRLAVVLDTDEPIADSVLEAQFKRMLAEHRIDGFQQQFMPPWYDGRKGIVDFAHPAAALVVEVDGRPWHTTTQAMTTDRRRDRLAAANGWLVIRVTSNDLVQQPTSTAEDVLAVLAARMQRRPESAA